MRDSNLVQNKDFFLYNKIEYIYIYIYNIIDTINSIIKCAITDT